MEVSQSRLTTVFEALNTTPNAFAKAHGLNAPTLYGFINGVRSPGFNILAHICESEPRISAEYLLRGTGSPLRDAQRVTDLATADGLEAFKQKMVAALDKQIQELRETIATV
jgi:hypothetical protein